MNKNTLIEKLTKHLENMCAYHAIGDRKLFIYNAGRADSIRELLEEFYNWDERYADEHIKNMWDIMDENW